MWTTCFGWEPCFNQAHAVKPENLQKLSTIMCGEQALSLGARGREGPCVTDTESESLRAVEADRGQLRTAARLFRGSTLLSPTEATADATTSDTAQNGRTSLSKIPRIARRATSDSNTSSRTSVKKKRQVHPGLRGERNSHISAFLVSLRGLLFAYTIVQLPHKPHLTSCTCHSIFDIVQVKILAFALYPSVVRSLLVCFARRHY